MQRLGRVRAPLGCHQQILVESHHIAIFHLIAAQIELFSSASIGVCNCVDMRVCSYVYSCACVCLADSQVWFLKYSPPVTLSLPSGLGQLASELWTLACLCHPYRGDKQEPLSLPPVYSAQFGEFCLFVFMFIYWWGMHMEVRILVQVVSLLPSGGFWGLNSAPQFEGKYLS